MAEQRGHSERNVTRISSSRNSYLNIFTNYSEKCHRTMRSYHKSSMDRQKELEEELQNARESYEKMTKKHLAEEHELRSEK